MLQSFMGSQYVLIGSSCVTCDIRYYRLSVKPHIKPVMTFFKETQPDLREKSKHEKIGQVTTSLKSLVMCMNKSIHTRLPFKGALLSSSASIC